MIDNVMQPPKPEKIITAQISCREAHLLKELRLISFGTFTVHKQSNLIVRLEVGQSKLIKEDDGLDIAITK